MKVAGDTAGLVAHIVGLLRDVAEQRQLGQLGRQYVQRHFNWSSSVELLDQVCQRAARRGRAVVEGRRDSPGRTNPSPAKESLGAVDTVA